MLVLDGDRISALAIVRSLGKKGLRVEVGSSKENPIAGYSKFSSRTFIYPDPLADVDGFRDALTERLRNSSYSLIVPVTDLTISPLLSIRASIGAVCPVAMASDEALRVTSSKGLTCELAQKCHVPVPKTLVVRERGDLERWNAPSTYPLVVKPDRSKVWLGTGSGTSLSVTYAFNREELGRHVTRLLQYAPVVIQEYVRGEGVGLGLLAQQGKILFAFQYRRLHEVPISGGASSYRVSEPLDSQLLAYASSLLGCLRWDGVAMVEFKRDRTSHKLYLMEINGRFWGSLPLAIAAGADFPAYLVDMMLDQLPTPSAGYKTNVRCRQLSRDVEWLAEAMVGRRGSGQTTELPSYTSILVDTLRILNPLEGRDTFDRRDVRPWLIDLGRLHRAIFRRAANVLWRHRAMRRMRNTQAHSPTLVARVLNARSVLVVCSGNVVRSPFCAHLLRRLLENRARVAITSAGVWASPGTVAHPTAVRVAREFGVDLGAHISSRVTDQAFASADLVLVMEFSHLAALRGRFRRSDSVFLVGCLSSDVPLEVEDPIDGDDGAFRTCFRQILQTLAPLALAAAQWPSPHWNRPRPVAG